MGKAGDQRQNGRIRQEEHDQKPQRLATAAHPIRDKQTELSVSLSVDILFLHFFCITLSASHVEITIIMLLQFRPY